MTTSVKDWELGGSNRSSYQRFLDNVDNLSTKQAYINHLDRFLDYAEIDSEFLFEKAKEAIGDPIKIKDFESILNKILSEFMIESQYKISSMEKYVTVLNRFFDANGVYFKYSFSPKSEIADNHAKLFKKESAESMTKEELKGITESLGNPRNLAICYFSRDSGLRGGDCINLKMKHIEPILGDDPPEFFVFEKLWYPEKNVKQARVRNRDALPATIIIGYEAIHYIRRWVLKFRESLLKDAGLDPNNPESYVFCSQQNKRGSKVGDKISIQTISNRITELRDKLGYRKNISLHSLRNNHSTDLLGAGMPRAFLLVLQGKSGDIGSLRDYTNPQKEKLLEWYKKCYHELALETKETEELKILKETVKKQENELSETKASMNERLADMSQALEDALNRLPVEPSTEDYDVVPNISTDETEYYLHPEKGLYQLNKPKSFDNAEQSWIDKNGNHYVAEFKEGLDYNRVQEILRTTKPNEVNLKHPELFKNVEKLEK